MMEGSANGSSSRCSTSGISVSAELAVIRAKSFRPGARMLGLIKRRFIEPDCKSGDGTGLFVLTGPGKNCAGINSATQKQSQRYVADEAPFGRFNQKHT